MERSALGFLTTWLSSTDRKPLVLRGPRQVGKTWLVRHFAEVMGKELIEINFEKKPLIASLFSSNDPKQILLNLSASFHIPEINPLNSLLFLDEIQATPEIFAKLRWFAEDMPELPVIATGSLLEFVLESHSFSMPVGRINYMHLEPLSFEEYLLASHKKPLYDYLCSYEFNINLPLFIHEQLMSTFKEYLFVGGLPTAVKSFVNDHSLMKINQIHNDLLATYRDDFSKYNGRMAVERLDEVMNAIPKMLGEKFIYSRVNRAVQSNAIKSALDLLIKARVCHRVNSCSANGVPLGAEINEKHSKIILLDTGLSSASLGLSLSEINEVNEIILINSGGISEQGVGQLLRTLQPPYIEPALYYWLREEKGSSAEIDYVIQFGSQVIPIEVKSGSTGSLKSLHVFMESKKLSLAFRINSDLPSKVEVRVKGKSGNIIDYRLLSIPFYLIGQIPRLLKLNS